MSLESHMLLRWLARQSRSFSLQEIHRAWEPTWHIDEIETMLCALRQLQAIEVEAGRTRRYRVQNAQGQQKFIGDAHG